MLDGTRKLIRDEATGAIELFDLARDPLETRNEADAYSAERERLLERLAHRRTRLIEETERVELSPSELDSMRHLGYAGD